MRLAWRQVACASVLAALACSSRPSVPTGRAGSGGGAAGTLGAAGDTGTAGDTGGAGTTSIGGATGLAGTTGAAGAGGAPARAATFDVCTCNCLCAGGSGTAANTPCWPNAGQLCTCDMVCGRACPKSGLGNLVSSEGTCAHTVVPVLWSCPLTGYGTGDGCTCGCGAVDPDCAGPGASVCKLCNANGSCAKNCTQIQPIDNASCADVPPEWTCSPGFFGRGDGCDCGCGAVDPDCADATQAACEFCGNPGACALTACDDILPGDNAHCR